MAGKTTVLSSPELRPRGSHHLVLPFRGGPVRETPGSSSHENNQAEEDFKTRTQKKSAHHSHDIKIKSEDDNLEPAERTADIRISLFTRVTTRAANAIKPSQERHLGQSNSKELGRPVNKSNMNQGNLIDLTLDSDEELEQNPPRAAAHGLAPPNRPVSHLSPPPDDRPPTRDALIPAARKLGPFQQLMYDDAYARGMDEGWGVQEHMYDHEFDDFGMRFQERMQDEGYLLPLLPDQVMHNQAPVRGPEAEWVYEERMRGQALGPLEGQYGLQPHIQGGAPPGLNEGFGFPPAPPPAPVPEQVLSPGPEQEQDIFNTLENMFPGICPDFVFTLFKTMQTSEQIVDHILTLPSYPRAKETQEKLKRKRNIDPDVEAARKYSSADLIIPGNPGLRPYM